jgi:hypothetical protein
VRSSRPKILRPEGPTSHTPGERSTKAQLQLRGK